MRVAERVLHVEPRPVGDAQVEQRARRRGQAGMTQERVGRREGLHVEGAAEGTGERARDALVVVDQIDLAGRHDVSRNEATNITRQARRNRAFGEGYREIYG